MRHRPVHPADRLRRFRDRRQQQGTLVTLGDLTSPGTLLTVFGLLASIVLVLRRLPGAIFFGMVLTALLGMATGVITTPHAIVGHVPSVAPVFGVAITQLFHAPGDVFTLKLLVVGLTFLFVEFFDSAGTLIDGNRIRRSRQALLADSGSVVASAVIGTSPTTSYIESAAGVVSGARTGFAPLVTASLFVLAFSSRLCLPW